ncbi:MAG: efflux RND transporter periplasmic adaptor subunit [Gammaproteobacteria bacterium]|nr:efflux RND transporter periplasmic adaptor subunit [Gammaproteobacteria bacterium]
MMKKVLIPALVIVASIFGAMTLMATAPKLTPSSREPIPTTVRVTTVEPQRIRLSVSSQGTVNPSIESQLIPEVSGRVVWMSPALVAGGYFQEGDPLLRLDDQDLRASVARAEATLTRAKAEHQHAGFEYQRLNSLGSRQLASRSQIENSLRGFRIAQAAQQDAEVAFQQAKRDLDRGEIRAPFTGLVRSKKVDIGQFIARGNSIATIYATDIVEIRLPIADAQLAYLNLPLAHRGQLPEELRPTVTLSADYAGRQLNWHGFIVRSEAEIDMKSRMVTVVARVVNSEQENPLSVGLFVNAEIEGVVADNVIELPRNALRNGNRVLIVDDDNRLFYRNIVPLRLYRDKVLIREGLNAGDRVCLSPLQTVIEGMRVKPLEEPA